MGRANFPWHEKEVNDGWMNGTSVENSLSAYSGTSG
jgi:hypothetical protein